MLLAAACVRPTGDFGRARDSFTHDVVMPGAGKWRAAAAGEAVSHFNLTDQEKLMHNRVWRFLIAPHSKDWFFDVAVEWQRTRLTPAMDYRFKTERYYDWLRAADYRSSRVRYNTLGGHIDADIATLPDTFAAVCAVVEVDRQRGLAAASLGLGGAQVREDVAARKAENTMHIGWFVRAVRYRHDAYALALDRLLVETPHEEAVDVDARLAVLKGFAVRAERHDFCSGSGLDASAAGRGALPSRLLMTPVEKPDLYLK